jgi:hypothetical protein
MPIRPDLRHLYRGPKWAELREKILKRAKNRCEQCRKPMHTSVFTYTWKSREDFGAPWRYYMVWASPTSTTWRNEHGRPCSLRGVKGLPRKVWVKLTVGHVDNVAEHMAPRNLKAWCTWCHLHHDQEHHKQSRSRRKDAGRPILQELLKHAS